VTLLRSRSVLAAFPARLVVPELFNTYPVPQTYKVNADAHADLRAQGLRELDIGLGEQVGALQAEGGGYWFGKAIYNAEGERGRGGVGFLSSSGAYSFLDIPVVRRWSVTALIVETDTIWASLVNNGERLDTSGGLLEYDRKTKRVTIHTVPAVIHTMVRLNRQIFLGTQDGMK